MKKNYLIFILAIVAFSCRNHEKYVEFSRSIANFESIDDYINDQKIVTNKIKIKNPSYFIFANNPYQLNKNSYLVIRLNDTPIYFGFYKSILSFDKDIINSSKSLRISFDILTPRENSYLLYRFGNKSTYSWNKEFNFIYACFFPDNQNIDKIHFFPSKDNIFNAPPIIEE